MRKLLSLVLVLFASQVFGEDTKDSSVPAAKKEPISTKLAKSWDKILNTQNHGEFILSRKVMQSNAYPQYSDLEAWLELDKTYHAQLVQRIGGFGASPDQFIPAFEGAPTRTVWKGNFYQAFGRDNKGRKPSDDLFIWNGKHLRVGVLPKVTTLHPALLKPTLFPDLEAKYVVERDDLIIGDTFLLGLTGVIASIAAPYLIADGASKLVELREKYTLKARRHRIAQYQFHGTKIILDEFDAIKQSAIWWRAKFDLAFDSDLTKTEDQQNKYLDLLKRYEQTHIEEIMETRTNFLSYWVVSPSLAESDRQSFIGAFSYVFDDDHAAMMTAAKIMAKTFRSEQMETVHDDVRKQFLNVFKRLKERVGKEEWEELQVLQTLQEGLSKEKRYGAEVWWSSP